MSQNKTTATKYAAGTKVSSIQSQEEIKKTLRKFGATGFAQAEDIDRLALLFVIAGGTPEERRVRFTVALPSADEFASTHRTTANAKQEQETNRLWRALAAGIKAKLILVAEGIETLEEAFYANLVLPDNSTIYESTHAGVAEAYKRGLMPPALLPALPAASESNR